MINTTLLDNYIKDSGLDMSVIAENLNLSEREFVHKKDNVKDFSVMEILTLCDILQNITDPVKLFFAVD